MMEKQTMAVHKLEVAVDLMNDVARMEKEARGEDTKDTVRGKKISPVQVEDMIRAFHLFDRNDDKALDIKELGSVFRALGQNPTNDQLKQIMKEADVDRNGKIDKEEYIALLTSHMQSQDEVHKELEDAFQLFDRDHDGKLTKKELVNVLRVCGDPLTPDEANELMHKMDKNRDGYIDINEFTSFLCTVYPEEGKDNSSQKKQKKKR